MEGSSGTETDDEQFPHRIVDRVFLPWQFSADREQYIPHTANVKRHRSSVYPLTMKDLNIRRGPLRRVVHVGDDQCEEVATAIRQGGYQAAGSVAVAMFLVAQRFERTERPLCHLTAGAPTTRHSTFLVNRVASDYGARVSRYRDQWVPELSSHLARIVSGWIDAEESYTEVASSLAWVFSLAAATNRKGTGGLFTREAIALDGFVGYLGSFVETHRNNLDRLR